MICKPAVWKIPGRLDGLVISTCGGVAATLHVIERDLSKMFFVGRLLRKSSALLLYEFLRRARREMIENYLNPSGMAFSPVREAGEASVPFVAMVEQVGSQKLFPHRWSESSGAAPLCLRTWPSTGRDARGRRLPQRKHRPGRRFRWGNHFGLPPAPRGTGRAAPRRRPESFSVRRRTRFSQSHRLHA